MSGTRELKALILMIDENRQTIGNSQYAFKSGAPTRDVIQQFSSSIPRTRRAAFQRIKELFMESIPWAEQLLDVVEPTKDYVWSLVYPLRTKDACDETAYKDCVEEQRQIFLDEIEDMTRNAKYNNNQIPFILENVKAQGLLQFQHEEEALALWYRQRRESEALDK